MPDYDSLPLISEVPKSVAMELQKQQELERELRDCVAEITLTQTKIAELEFKRNDLIVSLREGDNPYEWDLIADIVGRSPSRILQVVKKHVRHKAKRSGASLQEKLDAYNAELKRETA